MTSSRPNPTPRDADPAGRCATCGHESPAEARFCRACGSPLAADKISAKPSPGLCASCRAPVLPGTEFCRQCGSKIPAAQGGISEEVPYREPRCRACGATLSRETRFCRKCGAEQGRLAAHPAPKSECSACSAPTSAGERFCRSCGARQEEHAADSAPSSGVVAHDEVAPPSTPSVAEIPTPARPASREGAGARTPRNRLQVAGVTTAALALAGGAAFFALRAGDDRTSSEPAREPQAPSAEQEARRGFGANSEADSPPDNAGEKTAPEAEESAEAALRKHWQLIDDGDYDAAFELFHPDYQSNEGVKWVETKQETRPDVDMKSLEVTRRKQKGRVAKLDVSVVVADTAGPDADVCVHFVGWVRFQRVHGEWLYRPGRLHGTRPNFAPRPISRSDKRCRRVT